MGYGIWVMSDKLTKQFAIACNELIFFLKFKGIVLPERIFVMFPTYTLASRLLILPKNEVS